MPTVTLTAVPPFKMMGFGKHHQTTFKIVIS